MTKIMRVFEWDAGHRLVGHESKCAKLHGHRYKAELELEGSLDNIGRVMDFGEIKQIVGDWIDAYWDHNMLLNSQDPLLTKVCEPTPKGFQSKLQTEVFGPQWPYIFKDANPTAENIARELYHKIVELFLNNAVTCQIAKVRIWETPKCWAEYSIIDYHKELNGAKAKRAEGQTELHQQSPAK